MEQNNVEVKDLKEIVEQLNNKDEGVLLNVTKKLMEILSTGNSAIVETFRTKVVPTHFCILENTLCSMLQNEIALLLINISSLTPEHKEKKLLFAGNRVGTIIAFISLLNSDSYVVQEEVTLVLGIMAKENPKIASTMILMGIVEPLNELFTKAVGRPSLIKLAARTLSNICNCERENSNFQDLIQNLPILVELLNNGDNEILVSSCQALAYLSDRSSNRIQAVIDAEVCERIVQLLTHESHDVVLPALKTFSNIVAGDDAQTQIILVCQPLLILFTLLSNRKEEIRMDVCKAISYITAGSQDHIQAVIDAQIFPILIDILCNGDSLEMKRTITWSITNVASCGTSEQVRYVMDKCCSVASLRCLSKVMDSDVIEEKLNFFLHVSSSGEGDRI